jgi:hypothetical protein
VLTDTETAAGVQGREEAAAAGVADVPRIVSPERAKSIAANAGANL